MKKTRIWLVVLFLLMIASFAFMGILSSGIQEGRIAKDWFGVFGLLMACSFLVNIVIVYRYAWKTGRKAGVWVIGTLLLPYVVPIVLAFLPKASSGFEIQSGTQSEPHDNAESIPLEDPAFSSSVKEDFFTSISEPSSVFKVKKGPYKSLEWNLDQLRLFCILIPGSFSWRVVTSSQEMGYHFPDLLSAADATSLYGFLDQLCSGENPNDLSGIKICLADYGSGRAVLDLHKLRMDSLTLFASLYHFRTERSKKLNQWLSGDPQITLHGGLGSRATLNKQGFHLKKRSLTWTEVGKIDYETVNGIITHMYVLPDGYSGGIFDIGKMKYALARIPVRDSELYVAECLFWKTYCGV